MEYKKLEILPPTDVTFTSVFLPTPSVDADPLSFSMFNISKGRLKALWVLACYLQLWMSIAVGATLGRQENGFVTFYGPPPANAPAASPSPTPAPLPGALVSGACGFGQLSSEEWPYENVVALGPNNSIVTSIGANKLACGQCVKASCTSSNCAANSSQGAVLWVTDGCGGCSANQLNVPQSTFLRYFGATLGLGRVNVSYQQVDCDPPGQIQVKVVTAQAESGAYIALAFLTLAGSGMLSGVDIKTSGSVTWAPMTNGYGNVWEASDVGAAPLDIRISNIQGETVVAERAIPMLAPGVYETDVQFRPSAPGVAPLASALRPSGRVLPTLSPQASAPVPAAAAAPSALSLGTRVTVPLYFDPPDVTALGAYSGIIWSYVACSTGSPILNLTVARTRVPASDGTSQAAYALHTLQYKIFASQSTTPLYEIMDYSYLNLETGELAQLYQPVFASFSDPRYDGQTPVQNFETSQTVYPQYLTDANLSGPSSFNYTVLLPPGPNEDPTSAYLQALQTLFYFLSTLTLGNPGISEDSISCSPGYAQIGPWADYIRSIISQLAPSDQISGDLYRNIPLGASYAFQGTSIVAFNAIIEGRVINTTTELSGSDCGARCRGRLAASNNTSLCSAWSWCGSISGCGQAQYQTCQLKNSTSARPTISPNGFLNLQQNSSIRFTSGSLILPPPTGLNFSDTALNYSRASAPMSYGLMTASANQSPL